MSVCTTNISATVSEPFWRDDDSAESPTHLPPETKWQQKQIVVTTQIFYPQFTLINRQKRLHQQQTTRRASPICSQQSLCAACEGKIRLISSWSSVLSNSPHHFTFQFLLASTPLQWNLWFLDRVFLQNRSYRKKQRHCHCVCPLTVRLMEQVEPPSISTIIHLSLTLLWLVCY